MFELSFCLVFKWRGTGGSSQGRIGSGRGTGGRRSQRSEGSKQDSKSGGNQEKLLKISQHCIIFCNRNMVVHTGLNH